MSVTVNIDERIIRHNHYEAQYAPEDFINPDSWSRDPKLNRAFVFLNGGTIIGILFPEYYNYSEEDALDEAADQGVLDAFRVSGKEMLDYMVTTDGSDEVDQPEYERLTFLGNASKPFDIESLTIWRVPMSLFEEDSTLMNPQRVMDRITEAEKQANDLEKSIQDVEDPRWQPAYNHWRNVRDAVTVYRIVCLEKD